MADVDAIEGSDLDFSSYYVQVSYVLTGESRKYDHVTGGFRGVTPRRDFRGEPRGPGAWELGARYAGIDLNDGDVAGGELDEITLGLNWYLNANTRVMLNYLMADLDGVGDVDILQTRFQVFF